MPDQERRFQHFVLEGFTKTEPYRSPQQGGGGGGVPSRNRRAHGGALLQQLSALEREMANAHRAQSEAGLQAGFGLQVEFESFPDIELAFESLARERSGIELFNVRHEGEVTKATVFVPEGKLSIFENLLRDYLANKKSEDGKRSLDHKSLINTIREIRAATLRELWTDSELAFPRTADESFWWEVWLPTRGDRRATVENFRRVAQMQNFLVAPEELEFPERTVLLMRGTAAQLTQSMMVLNSVAELRRARKPLIFSTLYRPRNNLNGSMIFLLALSLLVRMRKSLTFAFWILGLTMAIHCWHLH